MKRKSIIVYLIVSTVIFSSLFALYPVMNSFFPDNGSVDRTFIFIKPTTDEIPYILILDDITTEDASPVEWIQHGQENLTLNPSTQSWQFTTKDYFNGNNVSLYGRIITEDVTLAEYTGYTSALPGGSGMAPYIVAETYGSQQLCTILVPLNESMTLPDITLLTNSTDESCVKIEHNTTFDIFWSRFPVTRQEITTIVDDWIPDAISFTIRVNKSDNQLLSLGFQDATLLQNNTTEYFQASNPITGTLSLSDIGLNGTITTTDTTTISIRMDDPGILLVDELTEVYSYSDGMMTFTLSSGIHTIGSQPNNPDMSVEDIGQITAEEIIQTLEERAHPYLLFNDSEVEGILENLTLKEPLQNFYALVNARLDSNPGIDLEIGDIDFENFPRPEEAIAGLILRFLNGSLDAFDALKLILSQVNEYPYTQSQTLNIARFSPAPALIYDVIYNNLTSHEKLTYAQNLLNLAKPLAETVDITPLNNHLGHRTGAVGMIGLAIQDKGLIEKALEAGTTFLKKETVDGIPIESFIYAHFGYTGFIPFAYTLKRLGLIDYFQEKSVMDRFFERTIDIVSPSGISPHYEDAGSGRDQLIHLRAYSHFTDNQNLRQKISYINEIQNRSTYQSFNHTLENHFRYYELFVWKDPASMQSPSADKLSWITYEGGNGAFRTDWSETSVFISFNAKNYHQSHTRLDELSYEIHAYGALLSMNAGYPGWKKEHHAYTVSTLSSNTIRLNNQDQLQETCEGFSFHAFSKETDMVKMESGNLYRSPFHISQNPTYYILTILMQIMIIGFSTYLVYLLGGRNIPKKTIEGDEK